VNEVFLALGSILIPASGIFATVVFDTVHPDVNQMRRKDPDLTIDMAKTKIRRRRLVVLSVLLVPGIFLFILGIGVF